MAEAKVVKKATDGAATVSTVEMPAEDVTSPQDTTQGTTSVVAHDNPTGSVEVVASSNQEGVAPKMVTVTVPKAFILRLEDHQEVFFKAGVQEMREDYANHWWSQANGVLVYKPS